MNHIKINRNYKDRLFRFLFNEKEQLLELYNAVNQTNYTDSDDLIINTKDNVIYMTMKNDLSFIIYGIMNLYEHQSTWNPNMPLRNLIYTVDLYKSYIEENRLDIYSSRQISIPVPQAVIFYNGLKEEPEQRILKLSDSYERKGKESSLEFTTKMLNINYGKNQNLMTRCHRLMEYSIFIDKIRTNHKIMTIEKAVDYAIEECIKEKILDTFLIKHKGEVTMMILEEYDEQIHIENEKRISEEDGMKRGIEQGIEQGVKASIEICKELELSREETQTKIMSKFLLSVETAEKYLLEYW